MGELAVGEGVLGCAEAESVGYGGLLVEVVGFCGVS